MIPGKPKRVVQASPDRTVAGIDTLTVFEQERDAPDSPMTFGILSFSFDAEDQAARNVAELVAHMVAESRIEITDHRLPGRPDARSAS